MRFERTPVATASPWTLSEAAEYLRLDAALMAGAVPILDAAVSEVEAHAGLALMAQGIVATTAGEVAAGEVLDLPVGPVALDATATVHAIAADGTAAAVAAPGWLEGGRFPRFRVSETATPARWRIAYPAGFGDATLAVPADLRLAVMDQALRLHDRRGELDGRPGLSAAAARILARYVRVRA